MLLIEPELYNDPAFHGLIAIALLLIGPCLGSFASAIAYRAPRGISWIKNSKGQATRSACTHCGYQLKFLDLIPILSWLLLRGKCRSCQACVSALYPTLEITALICALLLLYQVGIGLPLLMGLLALPFILALNVIAWQGAPLPRQLSFILMGVAALPTLLGIAANPSAINLIIAPLVGAAIYALLGAVSYFFRSKVLKRQADVGGIIFLAGAGMWFNLQMFPAFLITAGICGVVLALIRRFLKMPQIYIMSNAYTAAFLLILVFGTQIKSLLLH